MTTGGKTRIIKAYTTTIRIAAYIPNDFNGINGLNALAKKAALVVLEVVAVALAALRNE